MPSNSVEKLWKACEVAVDLLWIAIHTFTTRLTAHVDNQLYPQTMHNVAHIRYSQASWPCYLCSFMSYPHNPQYLLLPQRHEKLKRSTIV